jgi:hypothetical protein
MEAKIEATQREFQPQLKEVEAQAEGVRWTETGAGAAKLLKFDETKTWAVFRRQFETSRAQLLDAPREIHILDYRRAGSDYRRATWSPKRRDIWGNPWGPGGPFRRPAPCLRVSQSAKNKDPGRRGILPRICHSSRTPCQRAYSALPENHIRREAWKAFADMVDDPNLKIQLLLGGENNDERGSQANPRTAGRAPSRQVPQIERQNILRKQIAPTGWRDTSWSACWSSGQSGHFRSSYPYGREAVNNDRRRKRDERSPRHAGTAKKVRVANK